MDTTHPGHRRRVDGNAAGGLLLEYFGRDMTTARTRCAHCDRVAALADAVTEVDDAGVILLCRSCGHTLLTCLSTATSRTLALRGLAEIAWDQDPERPRTAS